MDIYNGHILDRKKKIIIKLNDEVEWKKKENIMILFVLTPFSPSSTLVLFCLRRCTTYHTILFQSTFLNTGLKYKYK